MSLASSSVRERFELKDHVAIITGGAGLLGTRHAEAIAEMGGTPVLVDVDERLAQERARQLAATHGCKSLGIGANICQPDEVKEALRTVLANFQRVDILINNAANNPKVDAGAQSGGHWSRLENFPLATWEQAVAVGLTGAFLCSQIIGSELARRGCGVILNIASDLGIIAPDQRIYRDSKLPADQQPTKPVSYSVVKHGIVGLTRYLATYWADRGVRVNSLSPGGVFTGQDEDFVGRLVNLIPLQRMADKDEYKAAIVFLVSDASSYMTGANLVIDGGRTVW
ncbi:MAG: SDR family oxidoreductase [Deltaproteobacteria bacterium]|nr:SDR family oxidoreductase [Deltaproteobacteria bacterium]